MNKGLCDVGTSQVDVLDHLWHDVLALRQLEDVLLTVDDLQGPVRQPLTDVA